MTISRTAPGPHVVADYPGAAGDFTLAAQVRVEFGRMYDAGVLLLHARKNLREGS